MSDEEMFTQADREFLRAIGRGVRADSEAAINRYELQAQVEYNQMLERDKEVLQHRCESLRKSLSGMTIIAGLVSIALLMASWKVALVTAMVIVIMVVVGAIGELLKRPKA